MQGMPTIVRRYRMKTFQRLATVGLRTRRSQGITQLGLHIPKIVAPRPRMPSQSANISRERHTDRAASSFDPASPVPSGAAMATFAETMLAKHETLLVRPENSVRGLQGE